MALGRLGKLLLAFLTISEPRVVSSRQFRIIPIADSIYLIRTPFGNKILDCRYEIPYLAGYSVNGNIIYIDRRLSRWETLKDGRQIDVYLYLIVHETWEKWFESKKGYKYDFAHEKATGKERQAVVADGIDWKEYQNYVLRMVKKLKTFSTPLPKKLDVKPEKDTHDYYRLHKIERLKNKSQEA